tara:strand:+ start:12421 stop:12639 length:219 start_codon:yes stop_codon:yes gene_type:complete
MDVLGVDTIGGGETGGIELTVLGSVESLESDLVLELDVEGRTGLVSSDLGAGLDLSEGVGLGSGTGFEELIF